MNEALNQSKSDNKLELLSKLQQFKQNLVK